MRRLALVALCVTASGCGRLLTVGTGTGSTLDAHVVYAQRPGCPTLLARTLDHGYTVMTPLPPAGPFEQTGVFEGPVRTGESVFRYTPPGETPVWLERPTEVGVDVLAVELALPAARDRWATACGVPEGADGPADAIPRLPAGL